MKDDRQYIESQADNLEESGLAVECILAGGDPASEIAAAVLREKCDLVAMSTHGHKGVQDLIRGSVANDVRHRVTVPVLMVRGTKRSLRQV
jgi:nucleotide-binding universal stress UspA family protein